MNPKACRATMLCWSDKWSNIARPGIRLKFSRCSLHIVLQRSWGADRASALSRARSIVFQRTKSRDPLVDSEEKYKEKRKGIALEGGPTASGANQKRDKDNIVEELVVVVCRTMEPSFGQNSPGSVSHGYSAPEASRASLQSLMLEEWSKETAMVADHGKCQDHAKRLLKAISRAAFQSRISMRQFLAVDHSPILYVRPFGMPRYYSLRRLSFHGSLPIRRLALQGIELDGPDRAATRKTTLGFFSAEDRVSTTGMSTSKVVVSLSRFKVICFIPSFVAMSLTQVLATTVAFEVTAALAGFRLSQSCRSVSLELLLRLREYQWHKKTAMAVAEVFLVLPKLSSGQPRIPYAVACADAAISTGRVAFTMFYVRPSTWHHSAFDLKRLREFQSGWFRSTVSIRVFVTQRENRIRDQSEWGREGMSMLKGPAYETFRHRREQGFLDTTPRLVPLFMEIRAVRRKSILDPGPPGRWFDAASGTFTVQRTYFVANYRLPMRVVEPSLG
ncbi:hypothetical protein C8J56DRAFT_1094290 [Mycena floridula]|nr:hypothetical protein C8J56DRAFT_1094290 [Mycena floridula]